MRCRLELLALTFEIAFKKAGFLKKSPFLIEIFIRENTMGIPSSIGQGLEFWLPGQRFLLRLPYSPSHQE